MSDSLFVCPECGTLILGDAVTCVKCGAPVTKEELVPAKKEQINHFYLTCVDKVPKAECAQDYRALEKSFDFLGDFESSKEFKQKCKELGDACTENERHLDDGFKKTSYMYLDKVKADAWDFEGNGYEVTIYYISRDRRLYISFNEA